MVQNLFQCLYEYDDGVYSLQEILSTNYKNGFRKGLAQNLQSHH